MALDGGRDAASARDSRLRHAEDVIAKEVGATKKEARLGAIVPARRKISPTPPASYRRPSR